MFIERGKTKEHVSSNCESKSESFYTSIGGYLVCIQIYSNEFGDGEGTYVFVFTQFL